MRYNADLKTPSLTLIFWLFLTLISLVWLRATDDAERRIDGPTIFISGFGACLLTVVPRAYYIEDSERGYTGYVQTRHGRELIHMRPPDAEWYWIRAGVPWPLVVSIALSLLRIGYCKLLDNKGSARSRTLLHLCALSVDVLTMIVLPTYILTRTHMRTNWPVDCGCPPFLMKDRFWTPSF